MRPGKPGRNMLRPYKESDGFARDANLHRWISMSSIHAPKMPTANEIGFPAGPSKQPSDGPQQRLIMEFAASPRVRRVARV